MKKFLALFAFLVAAGWTNAEAVDWNWKGDLRYRYEAAHVEADDPDDYQERHRIRARLGVYPWINEELSAGVQLVTSGKATSNNETFGDDFAGDSMYLREAYINYHPMDYGFDGKVNFILGKREVKQTLVRENDLLWDSDLALEGMTLQYGKDGKKQLAGLTAVAGYYFVEENDYDEDRFLVVSQLAYNGEASSSVKYQAGVGYYNYQDMETTDYDILEFFGDFGGKFGDGLPWKIYGQYAVNTANDIEDEDQGYLVGAKIGKAKKVGQWELDANYSRLEEFAVNPDFTDSDRADGGTNVEGFEVGGTYHLVQNMTLGLKYLTGTADYNGDKDDVKIWQADMVVKF